MRRPIEINENVNIRIYSEFLLMSLLFSETTVKKSYRLPPMIFITFQCKHYKTSNAGLYLQEKVWLQGTRTSTHTERATSTAKDLVFAPGTASIHYSIGTLIIRSLIHSLHFGSHFSQSFKNIKKMTSYNVRNKIKNKRIQHYFIYLNREILIIRFQMLCSSAK